VLAPRTDSPRGPKVIIEGLKSPELQFFRAVIAGSGANLDRIVRFSARSEAVSADVN
jgi:hypothetical protein